MLSSCWLTSPFTGCFNSAIKGGTGSSGGGDSVNKPHTNLITSKDKDVIIANGSAKTAVTTHAPRTSHFSPKNESHFHHNEDYRPKESTSTPRKSKSMGRIRNIGDGDTDYKGKWEHNSPPVKEEPTRRSYGHRRVPSDGVAWCHSKELQAERGGMERDDKLLARTYKSEYRKKFRPFSQYQYSDGKFSKASKVDEPDNSKAWYKEVLELRKQADQYRCRGWGVETASDRMTEIYSKQVELWEQVSRRSSLQALSLATSAAPSRPISKAEKDTENSRRSSPSKSIGMRERPYTAPMKHMKKPAADKGEHKPKEGIQRHQSERVTGTAGRSVSVGAANRSPKRISRPPTLGPSPTARTERRPRPTSLATNIRRKGTESVPAHSEKKPPKRTGDSSGSPKRSDLRSREEKKRINEEEKHAARDISKDHSEKPKDLIKGKSTPEPRFAHEKYEPVVKTPPEPTRVKSPDQVLVKSPDPVNWTVPLDTGKTFTVTHNIPDGETARGTPSTEHKAPVEPRSRQTPEPTKLYQGSLAGTPITTAGTVTLPQSSVPVDSKSSQPKTETEVAPTKTATASSTIDDAKTKPVDLEKSTAKKTELPTDIKVSGKENLPEAKSASVPLNKPVNEKPQDKTKDLPSYNASAGTADPMTMSMYGSINGTNTKAPIPGKSGSGEAVHAAPMRRLDDPTFEEQAKPIPSRAVDAIPKSSPPSSKETPASRPAAYRVLEDPSDIREQPVRAPASRILEAPSMESAPKPKGAPYRVLEAPNENPLAGVEKKQDTSTSPSSSKTVTDALDKARNRFDSFWGSGKDTNMSSNV